ncbi:MAG: leucyl aminopeptidase [Pseudomonadota bacterium]
MTINISFQKSEYQKADTLIVGVFEDGALSDPAEILDNYLDGTLSYAIKANSKFKGKVGQALHISAYDQDFRQIIIIGVGKEADLDHKVAEEIGGKLLSTLKTYGAGQANIRLSGSHDFEKITAAEFANRIATGLHLKSYEFNKYKSKKNEKKSEGLQKLVITTNAAPEAEKLYKDTSKICDGVFLSRDLINEPPNQLHPESYAELIKDELKPLGVEVEVLDEKKMQKLGFGALLSVGQGSIRDSRLVIMKWNGNKKSKKSPLALVGKGVTFDTGGISLKPPAEMDLMKMDMGGSAAVVGAMKAIAGRKAKANVIGVVGLVENMPSDRAYRPGDIITSHAGKTIEVLNTDAEGRLVLADALTYVQEKYKPEVIIDLATLTGAIMVALGFEYCGAFANDHDLWDQLSLASSDANEKFWRMPLDEAYRKEMESEVGDLKNLGSLGRYGGACSAAGFLEHFIEDKVKWAHIDIAGTAWGKSEKPTVPKGGTGFAVRTLDRLVSHYYEARK